MTGYDAESSLRSVGGRRKGVDRRDFERQLDAPNTRQVDRQAEQIRAVRERRKGPGERQWEVVLVRRLFVIGQLQDHVLEAEENSRVHIERKVKVDRPSTPFFRMQIDLPHLTERIGFDEVPFVVDVEAVIDRVVLQVGDIPGDIDRCHGLSA